MQQTLLVTITLSTILWNKTAKCSWVLLLSYLVKTIISSAFALFLKIPCCLQQDNHLCVLWENQVFHVLSHVCSPCIQTSSLCFVLYLHSSHIVVKISTLIPAANNPYLALVSGGSQVLIVQQRQEADEHSIIKTFLAAW